MGSIQLLTDDGLKTVLFDGDQPSPRDMAQLREMFQYEPQLPMNEMGGTQTIPMTPALPEAPPEPAPPPELKPDTLTPEQREMAKAQTKQYEQSMQGPGMGAVATKLVRPRFAGEQPSQGEVAAGKGVARAVAGTTAFAKGMLGDEEGASRIDENLSNIPYEPGVAGLAEGIVQFATIASPIAAAGKARGASELVKGAVSGGAAGMLGFSGKQERLSDLVQQYPAIANPVTEYLASDEDDSFLEGRLKNALEFAGLDAAVIGTFALALKGMKGSAKAKPNGEAKLADELSKDVPKANPNHVVRPPKNGKVQVAHAGGIQLPDKVVEAIHKPVQKAFEAGSKIELVDKVIRPIKSRVEAISPRMANRLDKFELDQNLLAQQYFERALPFFKSYRRMSKADQKEFSRHAMNSKIADANNILNKYKRNPKTAGIMREFDDLRTMFNDLHRLGNDNGLEIQYTRDYLPRIMKDYDGFMNSLGKQAKDPIDQAIEAAQSAKNDRLNALAKKANQPAPTNTALTKFERREAIREYLESSKYMGDGSPGFMKERVVDEIAEDQLKYYGSFEENIQNYISNLTYRVSKNRFKGDVDNVVGYTEEIARLTDEGKITKEQARKVNDLIDARLTGGEQSIAKGWQSYRDAMYLTSIGNPISTITQASEFLLNAYRNGTLETLQTAGKTATGKGLRIKDLGLEEIAREFSEPLSQSQAGKLGAAQKALNNTLRKTLGVVQFKRMDELMKESNLNGAFLKAKKQLAKKNSPEYKEFIQKQSEFFEGETQSLVDAIRRGDTQDPNVKVFLFSKLSRTQPISLSEYSEFYLRNPNARPMYFLKSFGLKQLETTRRDVLRKLGSGNADEIREGYQQALRLSVLFGGGMTANNLFKDYLLDRDDRPGMGFEINIFDPSFEIKGNQVPKGEKVGDAAVDALWTMFGLSRYFSRKFADDPYRASVDMIAPPKLSEFSELLIEAPMKGDLEQFKRVGTKQIPIGGKIYNEHWGAASEYKRKQRKKGRRKTALD